jgi:phage gp29-like protein
MAAPTFRQRISAAWDALLSAPVTVDRSQSVEQRASKKGLSDLQRLIATQSPNVDKSPVILGPSMSPVTVSSALRRAERGYMRALCDLLSEQRETVTHLQGELGKREDAIAACPLIVEPAKTIGKGKTRRAERNAEYLRARIDGIDGVHDAIKHLAGGIYFGRSGLETEFMRDSAGLGIRAFHPILPKRFSYVADWRVHLYDEAGNDKDPRLGRWPGVDIRKEWPDKFVAHEPKVLGPEPPTRQGLGRVLVWAGMFWKWDAKHWLQFAELFANPWRVGFYDKAVADANDIENLKQGLIELSGMTTAVFADSCKPMFLQAHDSRVHKELFETWCSEISKVVNGGTLATEMDSNAGSRSAAEVHEREGAKLKVGDGRAIDATMMRDVWRPLIRRQFGEEDAALYCPTVHLDTIPAENVDAKTKRIFGFVDRGGEVDMDGAREVLTGLPKPKEGAKLLKPLGAIAPIAKAVTEASAKTDTDKAPEKNDDGEPDEDAEPDKKPADEDE